MAATILHKVVYYSNYECLGNTWFRVAIEHVMISHAVGCLKSLVSAGRELLSHYCWTTNCELDESGLHFDPNRSRNIINLSRHLFRDGVSIQDCMWVMACVWGGSTPEHHGHVNIATHDRVIGIAAPELTFLSDVLRNPKQLASRGLTGGFISVQAGSIPVLPRDGSTNLVIAADLDAANSKVNYVFGRGPRHLPEEDTAGILFSTEPYFGQGGSLCAVLCAWQYGQVLSELDPLRVLSNLIIHRTLASYRRNRSGAVLAHPSHLRHSFLPLRRAELPILQSSTPRTMKQFKNSPLTAIVRAEGRTDWQVVAAGAVNPGKMILACEEGESLEEMLTSGRQDPDASHGCLVVVCWDKTLPSNFNALESQYRGLAANQSQEVFHSIDLSVADDKVTWKADSVVLPFAVSPGV